MTNRFVMGMATLLTLIGCGPVLRTAADACEVLSGDSCDKAVECGQITSAQVARCVGLSQALCCSQIDCEIPIKNPSPIHYCEEALRNESCLDLNAGYFPVVCEHSVGRACGVTR